MPTEWRNYITLHAALPSTLRSQTNAMQSFRGKGDRSDETFTTPKTLSALFAYIAMTGRWFNTFREIPNLEMEQTREKST
jgi:hypothetical protein